MKLEIDIDSMIVEDPDDDYMEKYLSGIVAKSIRESVETEVRKLVCREINKHIDVISREVAKAMHGGLSMKAIETATTLALRRLMEP